MIIQLRLDRLQNLFISCYNFNRLYYNYSMSILLNYANSINPKLDSLLIKQNANLQSYFSQHLSLYTSKVQNKLKPQQRKSLTKYYFSPLHHHFLL